MIREKENFIYNEEENISLAKAKIVSDKNIDYYMDNLIAEETQNIKKFDLEEDCSDEYIQENFAENFTELYKYKNSLKYKKIVYLAYIENISNVKYAALKIVKYLKEKFDVIILYSTTDAEQYWLEHKFTEFYNGYYIFIK